MGCEDRLGQIGHDVVEKGLLLVRFDGVEAREGEADEPVRSRVGGEGVGHYVWQANGLGSDGGTANVNGLEADGPVGERRISVGDVEGALEGLERLGFAGVVDGVTLLSGSRKVGVENPSEIERQWEIKWSLSRGNTGWSYVSDEPLSKFMIRVWPPTLTGERNWASFWVGEALVAPSSLSAALMEALVDALILVATSPSGTKLMSPRPNLYKARL